MPSVEFDPLTSVHFHGTDPGIEWTKDATPAIEVNPLVPGNGALTPNVVAVAGGGYRMYYTGFAPGVKKNDHLGHILSASSPDGSAWTHGPRREDRRSQSSRHGAHAVS